jgi:hypothetical protein
MHAPNWLNSFCQIGVGLPGRVEAMRKETQLYQRHSTSLSCSKSNLQRSILTGADFLQFWDGVEAIENPGQMGTRAEMENTVWLLENQLARSLLYEQSNE